MGMQKLFGLGMILIGCIGLGLWYSSQFQKQLKDLREMCGILELLLGEIRFGRSTLPECCFHMVERVEEPYKNCFREIYESACRNQGESFGEICREHSKKYCNPWWSTRRTRLASLPVFNKVALPKEECN